MKSRFDFVVVGGGTAGCVIAARLSEDPDVSVLLLEAGGDETLPDVRDPARWEALQGTEADWGFVTGLQRGTGRSYSAPRGRVLGGSGSINCMAHIRGHRNDFDGWAQRGAKGWDYGGVLGYFKRSEDVPEGDVRFRGRGGPLRPRTVGRPNPIAEAFVEAAVQVGHVQNADFSGAEMMGVGYVEQLVRDGERESTATAYLRPAIGRPNLTVLTHAMTLGLSMAGTRCEGVRFAHRGQTHQIAAGEVVLASGAVGSPQMLMVSGIGPRLHLESVGVDVVHDLPGVGQNLQDHILLAGIRFAADRPLGEVSLDDPTLLARTSDGDHGPDLLLTAMAFDYHMPWQLPSPNSVTFAVGHMRPRSRGSVTLRSADITVAPGIDPGYLREQRDLHELITGIAVIDEIVEAGAYAQWGGRSETARLLALPQADLERAVRDTVSSYFHLSGTCRMGLDAGAVVDPELRVRGIDGLRIADASVMPNGVSCNTNAATVMIGEKAADLLRGRSIRE